jgi:major membrane immunogen (membrane-anchored lipoprotein)
MKRKGIFCSVVLLLIMVAGTAFQHGSNGSFHENMIQDTLKKYRDGIFEGRSRASYTDEPYWGIATITIKEGLITDIKFIIRDSSLHETFNEKYEKHFEGNQVYIQQSRNDWKGVQTYPKKLTEIRDIDKVDAISGATWSYNIFKASFNEAIKNTR